MQPLISFTSGKHPDLGGVLVTTTSTDIYSVVRETLRANSLHNAGTLPPPRLHTIAMQIGQFLLDEQPTSATLMGRMLFQQGIGLKSLLAVVGAVQADYLRHGEQLRAIESYELLKVVIESFVEHQIAHVRSEHDRFRQTVGLLQRSLG